MTKIKILGILIFILSITLVFLSSYISKQYNLNKEQLKIINTQKNFTHEISKNIFYIYRHKNASTKQLDDSIGNFLSNLNNKDKTLTKLSHKEIIEKNKEIVVLWNKFYLLVENFRNQNEIISTYSMITIQGTVNAIYKLNLELVIKFDELMQMNTKQNKETINSYKLLQYALFFTLFLLFSYLVTQLQSIISFIQKFTNTSKHIIDNSSIKELEPIEVQSDSDELQEASKNFNTLIDRINTSIKYASNSIKHSSESLELIDASVEDLLELLNTMDGGKTDKKLSEKEDAIIQSLEELTRARLELTSLKTNLDDLISHYK